MKEPRPGTKVRNIYELFNVNRGKPVHLNVTNSKYVDDRDSMRNPHYHGSRVSVTLINSLRDTYGMDIRNTGVAEWTYVGKHLEEV